MSKKKAGFLVALGAAIGAGAACAAYYFRYKSFNDELDRDFHDYEDEEDGGDEFDYGEESAADSSRNYIPIDSAKSKAAEKVNASENSAGSNAPVKEERSKKAAPKIPCEEAAADVTVEEDLNEEDTDEEDTGGVTS